jgi:hypothetical protein
MKTLEKYEGFNFRRYGNPWVAIVGKDGKPDFTRKIGGYTGRYNAGEAGELYVIDPQDRAVYMYGQKDLRGNKTDNQYVQYLNGEFVPVAKTNLVAALNAAVKEG